ncbi:MAG TPA: Lrp/AsnC family transcriptional regulator [Pseudolysinimonas sp.]|nr:Lrp/AsnC family transcriptional regulator [Pseudolysinimonas sp.]
MPEAVDDKDLQLVELLRDDGRLSYSELGKAVSLSADAVRARLDRMVDAGDLRLVALVDPALVGRSVRISVGITVAGDPDAFAAWCRARHEIIHLVRTLGRFTFFAEVITESLEHAHRFVAQHLSGAPGWLSSEMWPVLRIDKWREDTRAPHVERSTLDRLLLTDDDRELLRELVISPRIQFRELSERLDRPYATVRRRAIALLKAGVIRPTVSTNELVFTHSQLAIVMIHAHPSARDGLASDSSVTILTTTGGAHQFIGEIMASSIGELGSVTDRLQETVSGISSIELLPYVAVDKLPASLEI